MASFKGEKYAVSAATFQSPLEFDDTIALSEPFKAPGASELSTSVEHTAAQCSARSGKLNGLETPAATASADGAPAPGAEDILFRSIPTEELYKLATRFYKGIIVKTAA